MQMHTMQYPKEEYGVQNAGEIIIHFIEQWLYEIKIDTT